MKKTEDGIFIRRGQAFMHLVRAHLRAHQLLSMIAFECQDEDGVPDVLLLADQAFIRRPSDIGMTRRQFKSAKKTLCGKRFRQVSAYGLGTGTVFTLISPRIFATRSLLDRTLWAKKRIHETIVSKVVAAQ